MNVLSNEIFEKYKEEPLSDNEPLLGFSRKLIGQDFSKLRLPFCNNNSIMVENLHNRHDILVGTKYDILFRRSDPRGFIMVRATIDYVTFKKNDRVISIPRGYGGFCRIKFEESVPKELDSLVQGADTKFDLLVNDIFYLTTRPVIDKLIELLDNAE